MIGRAIALSLSLLLRMQAQPPAATPAAEPMVQLVVTAASIDVQRLADALRVYLDEFGIQVVTAAVSDAGGELQKQLDDARRLGEAVRAVAVVRAERGARDTVKVELVDLATDKALVLTVPRPARDQDLYRALALKIQAVLRATLSEARAELDPRSSLGRLVASAEAERPAPVPTAPPAVAIDAGLGLISFPAGGPSFGGLALRASWRVRPAVDLGVALAAVGSASAASGDVATSASIVPVRLSARWAFTTGRAQWLVGPCVDATYIKIATSSAMTPVRPARNLMVGLGGEGEARLMLPGAGWLFARAAAQGVLNGERYDVAGAPVFDTSRLQISATVGAGVGLL
ncbi:MAG TPA: hypothetical protein VHU40_00700 [Polyangia bacterium]|nr:hypothetical protein [Polyangia bacterium]